MYHVSTELWNKSESLGEQEMETLLLKKKYPFHIPTYENTAPFS